MKFNTDCRFILFLLFILASHMPAPAEAAGKNGEQRRLLIINSYQENAPWSQNIITPVLLQSSQVGNLQAEVANMNNVFIRNDSLYAEMEEGIFQRYRDRKPDYLLLIGNMAFNLRDRIKREWGDIPMILVANLDGYAPRDYYFTGRPVSLTDEEVVPLSNARKEYNFTYVEAPLKYKETIDMMVRMLPRMEKLVFAADELYLNQRLDRLIHSYLASRYPHLRYERLVGKDGENGLQECLLSDDPTIGILFSTWFYERNNLMGTPTLVSGDFRLVASSPHPVFALRGDYLLEGGFLGGCYYNANEVQATISTAVDRLLKGEQARDIPFAYCEKVYKVVNYEQLSIDRLDIALCPQDTIFINKPLTFWEQYQWQVIACGIVLLAVTAISLLNRLFRKKKMLLYSAHNTLVRNMPVFYAQAQALFDGQGKVAGVERLASNAVSKALLEANPEETGPASIFYKEYILRFTALVLKEKHAVTFPYYFKQTNTYYEFIICQASQPGRVDIFGMDTTARHHAEKTLRETNKKLEMTLGVAHIIPWRWDLKQQTISCEAQHILKHMNFKKRKGSTAATNVIGADEYFRKVHPDDAERIRTLYQKLATGALQSAKEEFRIVSEVEGRQHVDWIEVNAMAEFPDEQGRPTSLLGSMLLITGRKQQEQALIDARERAKESDRLKSAFLANMSHEIRTPLNAIVGFSNLLTTTEDESEKKEFISIIEDNNQLLLQLISDILDLAKVEANTLEFNYQVTDLNELMRNLEGTVSRRLQPGVELGYRLGCADCHIMTERNRLSQVLINLLTNACKFTMQGSITFGYERRGEELYFYVTDTGLGISQENRQRIFERFTKVNSFIQGTGLGLSICQNIVQKMKGRIGVESEGEGKGSTFWFTIPYLPGETGAPAATAAAPREVVQQKKITILVAEDNESNYLLFKSILGKEYALLHAWDGVEAVELYRKHRPNIIIMDINMPNMDGYEATQEIRRLSATVPIIAVTAYAFASDKTRILESGFNGYVSKPVNAKELKNEIVSTISRSFILM